MGNTYQPEMSGMLKMPTVYKNLTSATIDKDRTSSLIHLFNIRGEF